MAYAEGVLLCRLSNHYTQAAGQQNINIPPFFVYRPLSLSFALRCASLLCLFDKCIAKFFQQQSKKRITTSIIIRIAKKSIVHHQNEWCWKRVKQIMKKERVLLFEMGTIASDFMQSSKGELRQNLCNIILFHLTK